MTLRAFFKSSAAALVFLLMASNEATAGVCGGDAIPSLKQLSDELGTLPPLQKIASAKLPEHSQKFVCNIQQAISRKGLFNRKKISGKMDGYTKAAIANFAHCYSDHFFSELAPDEVTLEKIDSYISSFQDAYKAARIDNCLPKFSNQSDIAAIPVTPATPPVTPLATPPVTPSPVIQPVEPIPPIAVVPPVAVAPPVAVVPIAPTTTKGCKKPAASKNRDITRNLATFKKNPHLCITVKTLREHGKKWVFYIITNQKRPGGPTWAVPHDNENSGFNAGLYAIKKYGGKMVAINTGGRRYHRSGQDPNRNFGNTKARTRSCRNMRYKPAPKFTAMMMRFYSRKYPFLTLHNNSNGGGISASIKTPVMRGLMSKTPRKGLSDPDDAILIGGLTSFKNSAKARRAVKYFHKRGVNVIYEHIRSSASDCSMSNHVLLNRLGSYYNIEAQHGHTGAQIRMINILMNYLGIK